MQRTLNTSKNWVDHINQMNCKKSEAFVRRCSVTQVFLKISQNPQKTPEAAAILKKRL